MTEGMGWPVFGRVLASALMVGGVPLLVLLGLAAAGALAPGLALAGAGATAAAALLVAWMWVGNLSRLAAVLRAAAEGRGVALAERKVAVRDGHTGPREPGTIGFATLRGGSVVGEHSVIFAGAGERIELTHLASDRGLFAAGAVKAALWAQSREPGFYGMNDVLGL